MSDGNGIMNVNVIEAGLRATALRSKVVANNVANINTPGFKRHAVRFEQLLAKQLESGRPLDVDDLLGQVFRPLNTVVEPNGNDVSIDVEVGEMVENGAMHKTYVRLLAKKYRQMALAMQT